MQSNRVRGWGAALLLLAVALALLIGTYLVRTRSDEYRLAERFVRQDRRIASVLGEVHEAGFRFWRGLAPSATRVRAVDGEGASASFAFDVDAAKGDYVVEVWLRRGASGDWEVARADLRGEDGMQNFLFAAGAATLPPPPFCDFSYPPERSDEFQQAPRLSGFVEVPHADRRAALERLASARVLPVDREDFRRFAGHDQTRKNGYLLRTVRYAQLDGGRYQVFKLGRQVYVSYGVGGEARPCEESVIALETDEPITTAFAAAGSAS